MAVETSLILVLVGVSTVLAMLTFVFDKKKSNISLFMHQGVVFLSFSFLSLAIAGGIGLLRDSSAAGAGIISSMFGVLQWSIVVIIIFAFINLVVVGLEQARRLAVK